MPRRRGDRPGERAAAPRPRRRARTSRRVRALDAPLELVRRARRGRRRRSGAACSSLQSRSRRAQRRSGLGELERAHDAPPVVRMDGGGRRRVDAPRAPRARARRRARRRAPPSARARRAPARGGSSSSRQRRAQVEAGAADDDRRPARRRGPRRSPRARAAGTPPTEPSWSSGQIADERASAARTGS